MAYDQRSLDDYVDVAERITDFRKTYPTGSLRGDFRMIQVGDQHLIAYRAEAWRIPDDPAPGVGCAWELVPGRTPFTKGSELQNAETSAWGRAIIAVGASDSKRGIASREEVQWRQAERDLPVNRDGSTSRSRVTDEQLDQSGQMTRAQLTEHNQLAKPVPNSRPVERVDSAVDDRWTSDAPSWAVGVDPPEDEPGSILPAQRSQIMAVYTALGIKDRQKRLDDIGQVLHGAGLLDINAEFQSTNDLSHQQAARLLENLHERHTGKMTRR